MNTWRMAMKVGTGGRSLWPICQSLSVAAITYEPLARINLSEFPDEEPSHLWAQLRSSQPRSLRAVAYEMKVGDTIYVKDGPWIVGKGTITGEYRFDSAYRIVDENGTPWPHQVPVDWDPTFARRRVKVGRDQRAAVELLLNEDSKSLADHSRKSRESAERSAAMEGEAAVAEVVFRVRNRALIETKKAESECCCEVCGFDFGLTYGTMGHGYIVAHHVNPIATGRRMTTLDDIALVCANCHAMAHTETPPVAMNVLRDRVAKARMRTL